MANIYCNTYLVELSNEIKIIELLTEKRINLKLKHGLEYLIYYQLYI